MIDIILAIIIGVISLIAALLIPSKAKIERNETARYKSSKLFIYAAGAGALFIGILVVILFVMNEEDLDLANILKIGVFLALGITLIIENIRKAKFLAQFESGTVPIAAVPMGVEVAAQIVSGTQPIAQQEVQVQQIGVKAMPPVQTQPQAPTQQIGVKAMPPVQARPQVPAQQIGVKATPTVQPQPQVVAQQPQPAAPPIPKGRIVVIKCPKCKGSMQINTAMLGQKMKCPHCGVEGKIG
ncbi:MAG: hypothetical protein V3U20_00695 [Thermoplasmata archaeon]